MSLQTKYLANELKAKDMISVQDSELLDLKIVIDNDIAYISATITEAKAKTISEGEYSDREWFRRATIAKKIKGGQSQMIQNELRKRRIARAEINRKSIGKPSCRHFLKAMELLLKPDEVTAVLAKAEELFSSEF